MTSNTHEAPFSLIPGLSVSDHRKANCVRAHGFARCSATATSLMGELQASLVRLTAKGRATYAARSGEHDDLVMAVALAVWFAAGGSRPAP